MVVTVLRRVCGLPFRVATLRVPDRAGRRRPGAVGRLALRLFVTAAVLAACSPAYDWRTVTNGDNGYSVDLPARPRADQRDVEVDGTPMHMSMQTAEVDDVVFVVGTLALPDAQPATQQRALAFLRDGLARNVGAPARTREVAVPVSSGGSVEGIEMELAGKAGQTQQARTLHARLVAKGARAYEVAIVGRGQPPVEQVDQFFQSFRLY